MKSKKIQFNILDIIFVFSVILIIFSTIFQGLTVNKFEENNIIENTVITLKLIDVDEPVFNEIQKGDYIFSNEYYGDKSIGAVSKKTKYSSTQKQTEDESEVSEIVEYEIYVLSECLRDSNGFYSINDKLIVPGIIFSADNGYVGFNCEIVSIKTAD